MIDPKYQPDVAGLAAELRQQYGLQAFNVAFDTARQHMRDASWKHCTMWLQVVNRLNGASTEQLTAS